jgi:hypothetical protein
MGHAGTSTARLLRDKQGVFSMALFQFFVDPRGGITPSTEQPKRTAHQGDQVVVHWHGEAPYDGAIYVTLYDKNNGAELFVASGCHMTLGLPSVIIDNPISGHYSIVTADLNTADGTKGDLNVGSGPGDGDDGAGH